MNWKVIQKFLKGLLKGKKPIVPLNVKTISKKTQALVSKEIGMNSKNFKPLTRVEKIHNANKLVEKKLRQGTKLTKSEIAIYKEYSLIKSNPKKWYGVNVNTSIEKGKGIIEGTKKLLEKDVVKGVLSPNIYGTLKANEIALTSKGKASIDNIIKSFPGVDYREASKMFLNVYREKTVSIINTGTKIQKRELLKAGTKEFFKLAGEPALIGGKVVAVKGVIEKSNDLIREVIGLKGQETENLLRELERLMPMNDLNRVDYIEIVKQSKSKLALKRDAEIFKMANGVKKIDINILNKEKARLSASKTITDARLSKIVNKALEAQADNYIIEFADKFSNNGKTWYENKIADGWSEEKIKAHLNKQRKGYLEGRKKWFKDNELSITDKAKRVFKLFKGQWSWEDSPRDELPFEDDDGFEYEWE